MSRASRKRFTSSSPGRQMAAGGMRAKWLRTTAKVRAATHMITDEGQRHTRVGIATEKAPGEMPTESRVEYDCLLRLVFDPDVARIQLQPLTNWPGSKRSRGN